MHLNKKSQAWGIDIIIGFCIFTIGIVIFIIYSINSSGQASEELQEISLDSDIILNSILSEGYPINWNLTNVEKIGILSDNKINQTKLEMFFLISNLSYNNSKTLLNTKFDYYLFFDNMTIFSGNIHGFGKPGTNHSDIDSDNLLKKSRFSIYNNEPKTVFLYVWENKL